MCWFHLLLLFSLAVSCFVFRVSCFYGKSHPGPGPGPGPGPVPGTLSTCFINMYLQGT